MSDTPRTDAVLAKSIDRYASSKGGLTTIDELDVEALTEHACAVERELRASTDYAGLTTRLLREARPYVEAGVTAEDTLLDEIDAALSEKGSANQTETVLEIVRCSECKATALYDGDRCPIGFFNCPLLTPQRSPAVGNPQTLVQHVDWLHTCLREAGYCIDGGKCHHDCKDGPCFREDGCAPLTGSGLDDNWQLPGPNPVLSQGNGDEARCPKCGTRVESIGNPCPAFCGFTDAEIHAEEKRRNPPPPNPQAPTMKERGRG